MPTNKLCAHVGWCVNIYVQKKQTAEKRRCMIQFSFHFSYYLSFSFSVRFQKIMEHSWQFIQQPMITQKTQENIRTCVENMAGQRPTRSRSRSILQGITALLRNLYVTELAREAQEAITVYQDRRAQQDEGFQHWAWHEGRWWTWQWNEWWTPWIRYDQEGTRNGTFWWSWTSWKAAEQWDSTML